MALTIPSIGKYRQIPVDILERFLPAELRPGLAFGLILMRELGMRSQQRRGFGFTRVPVVDQSSWGRPARGPQPSPARKPRGHEAFSAVIGQRTGASFRFRHDRSP